MIINSYILLYVPPAWNCDSMNPGILFTLRICLFIYACYSYFHGGMGLLLCETVALMSLPSFYRILDKFVAIVE